MLPIMVSAMTLKAIQRQRMVSTHATYIGPGGSSSSDGVGGGGAWSRSARLRSRVMRRFSRSFIVDSSTGVADEEGVEDDDAGGSAARSPPVAHSIT